MYYAVQQNCWWTTALMTDNPSNRPLVHNPFPSLAFGINLNTPQQNLYSISQCTACFPCCFAAAGTNLKAQALCEGEQGLLYHAAPHGGKNSVWAHAHTHSHSHTHTLTLSNTHACMHTRMVTPEATQFFIQWFSGRYYKSDSTAP